MKFFTLILLVMMVTTGGAQPNAPRPVTFYYTSSMQLTTPDKAVFKRVASLDLENIAFSGLCKDYVNGNRLIDEGFYDRGVNQGLYSEYYESGKLKSTMEFSDDGFIIWELVDQHDVHTVSHGNGKFSIDCYSLDYSGTSAVLHETVVAGEFLNGKRTGNWVYKTDAGVITDEETYSEGRLLKRVAVKDNQRMTETTKKPIVVSLSSILAEAFFVDPAVAPSLASYFELQPLPYPSDFSRSITFPGGIRKFLLHIARGLQTSIQEDIAVTFIIDEKGKIQKIRAGLLIGWRFSDELAAVIKPYESSLLPAIMNGKPVGVTVKLPICTSEQWIDYLQNAPDDDVNAYVEQINRDR